MPLRVGEIGEEAAAVGEHLLGVPVGRGHDGLAAPHGEGEGARGDLLLGQVGGDVEVGHEEELVELLVGDVTVEEEHVVLDAPQLHALLQARAVGFAELALDLGVRGAQHHVGEVGEVLDEEGHRLDGVLDALARPDEAEGEQDLPALQVVLVLVVPRVHEGNVGHAVGDADDLLQGHAVDLAQHAPGLLGDDHHLVGDGAEPLAGSSSGLRWAGSRPCGASSPRACAGPRAGPGCTCRRRPRRCRTRAGGKPRPRRRCSGTRRPPCSPCAGAA